MSVTTIPAGPGSGAAPLGAPRSVPAGHYRLWGVVASEWTKLRTVRSTLWTLGITVVLGIGLGALTTSATAARWDRMSLARRVTFDPTRTSLTGILLAQLAVGVLGVLVISAEYGTGTIRATFSAVPRRPLVLTAKTVVFGLVALVVGETVSFVAFFVGQALLTGSAPHAALSNPGVARAVVGAGLYLTVLGLVALGIGTLLRHTAGAISAFVGILLILPLIVAALPSSIGGPIGRYLPANIGVAMLSVGPQAGSFAAWTGFAILCGYAAALLVLGGFLLTKRDA
jgi:ABC-2 type transport system permease protein